jgi:hypothetical protein
MQDLDTLHGNIKRELLALRGLMPGFLNHTAYSNLFDEFVREYEFGSALETACDYLLDAVGAPVDDGVLNKVAALHKLMDVTDDCLQRLQERKNR